MSNRGRASRHGVNGRVVVRFKPTDQPARVVARGPNGHFGRPVKAEMEVSTMRVRRLNARR